MSKLKVAIIGVGGIARTHVPGWTASEDADLVAAADINEDGLKRWGKEHDVVKLVTEPAALFADPNIDIIDICTPNNYHAPLAIAAAHRQTHATRRAPLHDSVLPVRRHATHARPESNTMRRIDVVMRDVAAPPDVVEVDPVRDAGPLAWPRV